MPPILRADAAVERWPAVLGGVEQEMAMRFGLALSGAALVAAAVLCVPAHAGFAQAFSPGGIDPADGGGLAPTGGPVPNADDEARDKADAAAAGADDSKAKPEPPPSLPGSHALPMPVVPLDKNASDMNPNEALFDAINRGDISAARDALNRGADPNTRNVLGLTPIDEAVDLGRNDISFLLLSERASSEAEAAAAPAAHPARLRAPSPQADRGGFLRSLQAQSVPAPSSGFLGFGGGS
jgi:hypothetical protein